METRFRNSTTGRLMLRGGGEPHAERLLRGGGAEAHGRQQVVCFYSVQHGEEAAGGAGVQAEQKNMEERVGRGRSLRDLRFL